MQQNNYISTEQVIQMITQNCKGAFLQSQVNSAVN